MSKTCLLTILLLLLAQGSFVLANDNPIRKNLPYSIVEVLVEKPLDEQVQMAKPLPLDKIPFKQRTDKYISIGTAWFSSPKQLFSAAHVFSPSAYPYTSNFYIRNLAGEVYPIDTITVYSNRFDIIAFTLKNYPEKIIPISISKNFAIGEDVCAPGNALGEGISLRCGGQISSLNPEPRNGEWKELYFSTPVSPGNSGGPLLNSKGQAIGIIVRKIKGEDLNIAMPFSEIKKAKAKLEYYEKEIGFKDQVIPALIASKEFRMLRNQPTPAMDWMKAIVEGTNSHLLKMHSSFRTLWMKHSIVADKKARSYYMNPSNSLYFSQIKYGAGQNTIQADQGQAQDIPNLKRPLVLQAIDESLFAFVEHTKTEKVGLLLEKPREIMDTILASGMFLKRQIADESIAYTTIGEPYTRANVEDVLGRRWLLFRWMVKELRIDVGMFCTPRPSGVACAIQVGSGLDSNEVMAAAWRLNAAEYSLGYQGTSQQWLEFAELPAHLKPTFMADFKIQMEQGKLSVSSSDISLTADIASKSKDRLLASFSYNPKKPLQLLPFAITYFPNSDERMLATATRYYRGKSAEEKREWDAFASGEKPFDGEIYQTKEGAFLSTEVVSKLNPNCLILGFLSGDDEKKLSKFRKSFSFVVDDLDELSH